MRRHKIWDEMTSILPLLHVACGYPMPVVDVQLYEEKHKERNMLTSIAVSRQKDTTQVMY